MIDYAVGRKLEGRGVEDGSEQVQSTEQWTRATPGSRSPRAGLFTLSCLA